MSSRFITVRKFVSRDSLYPAATNARSKATVNSCIDFLPSIKMPPKILCKECKLILSAITYFEQLTFHFVGITISAVALKIGKQMVARVLEFIAVQPHTHEPDTEREQFIVAHRLAHDAGALGDGLRGHGKA